MRIFSKEVVSTAYKITKTLTGVECDICKRIIPVSRPTHDSTKYYEVTTGHRDWGNDSCDSVEIKDICPDCILGFVGEYLKTRSRTAYINIETMMAYPDKENHYVNDPPKEGEVEKRGHDMF